MAYGGLISNASGNLKKLSSVIAKIIMKARMKSPNFMTTLFCFSRKYFTTRRQRP